MGRLLKIGALALLVSLGAVLDAAAIPLDPIVRTRGGQIGSVPILTLPTFFDLYPDEFTASFPELPSNPLFAGSCINGSTDEFGGNLDIVTCEFANTTPQAITSLNFGFAIPGSTDELIFQVLDPDGFFATESIGPGGALFAGGFGIPGCSFEGDFCSPFHFLVDFVGFPVGTKLTMTAAEATAVPEPATLTLLGTGLALAVARRRRRR